jgi:hypothetical protein
MKKAFYLLIIITFIISCKSSVSEIKHIINNDYEIFKVENSKAVLVLFPCFPCDIQNTKNEFAIIDKANKEGITVLLMNFNRTLYFKKDELSKLSIQFYSIFKTNELKLDNVYIGGFSGGGNVSLLLTNYLLKNNHLVKPKGVFIVDSPLDLLGLRRVAQKNIASNFSKDSVDESNWIISEFDAKFGNPKDSITMYKKYSPYTFESKTISNLENLKDIKIRFYTEPDLDWWKKNRNNDKEDLNSFFIEKLYNQLKNKSFKNVKLIKTTNKGCRIDGTRHPHSWSIVDKEELLNWILE